MPPERRSRSQGCRRDRPAAQPPYGLAFGVLSRDRRQACQQYFGIPGHQPAEHERDDAASRDEPGLVPAEEAGVLRGDAYQDVVGEARIVRLYGAAEWLRQRVQRPGEIPEADDPHGAARVIVRHDRAH